MNTAHDIDTKQGIVRLWRRRPLLLIAFCVVVTLCVFFGARSFAHFTQMLAPRDAIIIEGWMTPRFIAKNWDVDEDLVYEALGITEDDKAARLPIARIARQSGERKREVVERIVAIIQTNGSSE